MITQKILGNIDSYPSLNKVIDLLSIEWYETGKRIMLKKTASGREMFIRFLNEKQYLKQGDVIFEDEHNLVIVDILACEVIIIVPATMLEMISICYEIGNRHLPLFYEGDELLVATDLPLFNFLIKSGYDVKQGTRKLINPVKTSVIPHLAVNNTSMVSKSSS